MGRSACVRYVQLRARVHTRGVTSPDIFPRSYVPMRTRAVSARFYWREVHIVSSTAMIDINKHNKSINHINVQRYNM